MLTVNESFVDSYCMFSVNILFVDLCIIHLPYKPIYLLMQMSRMWFYSKDTWLKTNKHMHIHMQYLFSIFFSSLGTTNTCVTPLVLSTETRQNTTVCDDASHWCKYTSWHTAESHNRYLKNTRRQTYTHAHTHTQRGYVWPGLINWSVQQRW